MCVKCIIAKGLENPFIRALQPKPFYSMLYLKRHEKGLIQGAATWLYQQEALGGSLPFIKT